MTEELYNRMTPRPGSQYEWDENKSRENLRKRGFGFDLIHRFEWSTSTTRQDLRSVSEERWISTGLTEERLYVVCLDLAQNRHPNHQLEESQRQGGR